MIREVLRPFYGREWRALRAALIACRGARCAVCGKECEKGLNLCHVTHDPRTSSLMLMCAACHARHDTEQRTKMTRRTVARKVGQLWLLDDIEWAPYPQSQIPAEVFSLIEARRQLELFP